MITGTDHRTYINETEFEMVLESVSRRLHAFYAILYVLKVFFQIYYCTLFKQKLQYFKGNAQSQAALSLWDITFFFL